MELYEDYEQKIQLLQDYDDDTSFLTNTVDYIALEVKSHINLLAKIATYMDKNQRTIKDLDIKKAAIFWCTINYDGCMLESNSIRTYDRMIPFAVDADFEKGNNVTNKYLTFRLILVLTSHRIKPKMNELKVEISELADFFKREYNVLSSHIPSDFGSVAEPNKKRINLAREVANMLYTRKI